jgi:hypothetical protein
MIAGIIIYKIQWNIFFSVVYKDMSIFCFSVV